MALPWMIAQPGSKLGITTTDPAVDTPAELLLYTIATGMVDGDFTCQITSAVTTPTAATAATDVPGSWCTPGYSQPLPGASTWTLDIEMIQDANDPDGLSAYLYEHDGVEGWVYMATGAAEGPPKCMSHVYLQASAIGGTPATPLTATVNFRCLEKPLWAFAPAVALAFSNEGGTTTTGADDDVEAA